MLLGLSDFSCGPEWGGINAQYENIGGGPPDVFTSQLVAASHMVLTVR